MNHIFIYISSIILLLSIGIIIVETKLISKNKSSKNTHHISAKDLLLFEEEFDKDISEWVLFEKSLISNNVKKSNMLMELSVANVKMFFRNSDDGEEFRKILLSRGFSDDFSLERLEDLYIKIQSKYPDYFLKIKKNDLIKAVSEIINEDIDIVKTIIKHYPYSWLFIFIQENIRKTN